MRAWATHIHVYVLHIAVGIRVPEALARHPATPVSACQHAADGTLDALAALLADDNLDHKLVPVQAQPCRTTSLSR